MKIDDYIKSNFTPKTFEEQIEKAAKEINNILDNFDSSVSSWDVAKIIPIISKNSEEVKSHYKYVIQMKVSCETGIFVNNSDYMHSVIKRLHANVDFIYVYNLSRQILNSKDTKVEILLYIK